MASEVILNIRETSKVWTSRKSNVNKSKNDECRCINKAYLPRVRIGPRRYGSLSVQIGVKM